MNVKYVKKPFGIVKSVYQDKYGNLYILNDAGIKVKMSATKWASKIPLVKKKCEESIGENVHIVTSQTTSPWSTNQYFCDIEIIR